MKVTLHDVTQEWLRSVRMVAWSGYGDGLDRTVDLVLVVVGVQPNTALAQTAGATLVIRGAVVVDDHMSTGVPDVYAAADLERKAARAGAV